MNSIGLLAVVAGSQGGGINPTMMQALVKMEEDNRRKNNELLAAIGSNVASGLRYLKGPPKIVDAAGKEIAKEDPRFSGILLAHKVEEDIKYEGLQNLINGGIKAYIATQGDSSSLALMMAGMNASGRSGSAQPTAGSARFGG